MIEYHKIQTIFKRDMNNKGRIIESEWSLPEFGYLANNQWTFTEKVDGTNIRLLWRKGPDGNVLTVRGKSDNAQIPGSLLEAIAAMNLALKLTEVFPDGEACLYGEGYGPGIQKGGGLYRKDKSFVLFDVLCGDLWLQRADVNDVALKLGIDAVPIVGEGTIHEAVQRVRFGMRSCWGDFPSEGLVLRPSTELRTRRGDRMIAKIKHVDFTGGKFN